MAYWDLSPYPKGCRQPGYYNRPYIGYSLAGIGGRFAYINFNVHVAFYVLSKEWTVKITFIFDLLPTFFQPHFTCCDMLDNVQCTRLGNFCASWYIKFACMSCLLLLPLTFYWDLTWKVNVAFSFYCFWNYMHAIFAGFGLGKMNGWYLELTPTCEVVAWKVMALIFLSSRKWRSPQNLEFAGV